MNKLSRFDRYLTCPPDDGRDGWAEDVIEAFSESFYNTNSDWIFSGNGLCNKWLNLIFNKGRSPKQAAMIIERAVSRYVHK